MPRLIATQHFYLSGIGDLYPGQPFEIGPQHARVLKAIGRAKDPEPVDEPNLMMPSYRNEAMKSYYDPKSSRAAASKEETADDEEDLPEEDEEEQEEEMSDEDPEEKQGLREQVIMGLRTRAAALGIEVDGRWGEERLRREIAAKSEQSQYDRRDLRAKS